MVLRTSSSHSVVRESRCGAVIDERSPTSPSPIRYFAGHSGEEDLWIAPDGQDNPSDRYRLLDGPNLPLHV